MPCQLDRKLSDKSVWRTDKQRTEHPRHCRWRHLVDVTPASHTLQMVEHECQSSLKGICIEIHKLGQKWHKILQVVHKSKDDYVNTVHFMDNLEDHFITCILSWLTVPREIVYTWWMLGRQSMMPSIMTALPWGSSAIWTVIASNSIWYSPLVNRGSGISQKKSFSTPAA